MAVQTPRLVLLFVIVMTGIIVGLGGMLLALLLHAIQHLAYGYPFFPIIGQNFLEIVSAAPSGRRVIALSACGLIAGFGWWALSYYGRPLISIERAIQSSKPYMPVGTTVIHILLQIITVGLGSPLGREVAPRELGATFACWFANKMKLSSAESQMLVACSAGAGLAAVFNVPLGGALFALEVLLCTWNWSAVLPAITISTIAVVISWIGLPNEPQYHLPELTISTSLVIWAIITGPIFGVVAYLFRLGTDIAKAHRRYDRVLIVLCLCNFLAIGLLAVFFPALLGNGKASAELGFSNNLSIELAIILLLLRIIIVLGSLRVGAYGGLLTPSLANGALMAVVLGGGWSWLFPGTPLAAFGVIGAGAFLAASQKMPLTAIILIVEFTGINFSFLVPLFFAVAGAVATFSFLGQI